MGRAAPGRCRPRDDDVLAFPVSDRESLAWTAEPDDGARVQVVQKGLGVRATRLVVTGQSLGLAGSPAMTKGGFALAKGRYLSKLARQIAKGLALGLVEQLKVEGDRVRWSRSTSSERKAFRYLPAIWRDIGLWRGRIHLCHCRRSRQARATDRHHQTRGRAHRGPAPPVAGAIIGFRGPYGKLSLSLTGKAKDIVIAGGGIGLAPLRPIICHVLNQRADYGKLTIV